MRRGPVAQRWAHRRRSEDRGSVLVLVPAGFLVLIVLAALAVDSAVAYLGQQQLHDALAAAATDSVTAGLDNGAFYGQGRLTLDIRTTELSVCESLAAQNVSGLHDLQVWMAVDGDAIRLEGRARVEEVFGRALPGQSQRSVSAAASAVAVNGPGATAPAALSGAALTVLAC